MGRLQEHTQKHLERQASSGQELLQLREPRRAESPHDGRPCPLGRGPGSWGQMPARLERPECPLRVKLAVLRTHSHGTQIPQLEKCQVQLSLECPGLCMAGGIPSGTLGSEASPGLEGVGQPGLPARCSGSRQARRAGTSRAAPPRHRKALLHWLHSLLGT